MPDAEKYKLKRVAVRLVNEKPLISMTPIRTPEDAIRVVGKELLEMDREYIYAINVDLKGHPVSCSIVGMGTIDSACLTPRELYKQAILSNASGVILLHNHPSGCVEPSAPDLSLTKTMKESGEILGIRLVDHLIVGASGYYSIESGQKNMLPSFEIGSTELLLGENKGGYYSTEKIKEITSELENGVKELFESERYRSYLDTVSRFHGYSAANCILISLQRPTATAVAGYRAWSDKFERHVKAGEKAIRIIAPCSYKKEVELEIEDPSGDKHTEKELVERVGYKIAYVFDIAQTEGKELPVIASMLTGKVQDYRKVIDALVQSSPVPLSFESIDSGANGYFSPAEKRIVVKNGLSEEQSVKTAIHEIAHAMLHDPNKMDRASLPDQRTKEVQAESVAYCVARYLGLDTSAYSFGYIAGWSSGRETKELKSSLQTIRDASSRIISRLEPVLRPELAAVRDQTMLPEKRQHKARGM